MTYSATNALYCVIYFVQCTFKYEDLPDQEKKKNFNLSVKGFLFVFWKKD